MSAHDAALAYGARLAALVRGIDRLYRAAQGLDPAAKGSDLSQEGLIAVQSREGEAEALSGWQDALRAIEALGAPPDAIDPARRRYLGDMRTYLDAVARWQAGEAVAFLTQVERWLALAPVPPDDAEIARRHRDLEAELRRRGLSGELDAMVARWWEDQLVPADRVLDRLDELQRDARAATEALLGPLPGPAPTLDLVGVHDVPWGAYVDLVGHTVEFNLDLPKSEADLRHLITHEAYPGHYTYFLWHEWAIQHGEAGEDAAIVLTSSPTSALFEGVGERGTAFIGWSPSEDPDRRIGDQLLELRSAVAARAAYQRHAQGLAPERVKQGLAWDGFYDEASVQARWRFLEMPLRRAFLFAYWAGRRVVTEADRAVGGHERAAFLADLYRRPHSAGSLAMRWGANRAAGKGEAS